MNTSTRRWLPIVGGILAVLVIGAFVAFQVGVRSLRGYVASALGPQGEVQSVNVTLTGLEVTGVRVRAVSGSDTAQAWPAADQLRADRILITPSLMDLLSAKVVVRTIRVEGAYISMLRARDGKMHVLPSLIENNTAPGDGSKAGKKENTAAATPVRLGKLELVNGTIDFFDATVRQPAHRIRLEKINAVIGPLQFPDLKGQTDIDLFGVIKGPRQDGKISISGAGELATRESGVVTRLYGVDLTALQPYLIKVTESGIKRGTLDFELTSSIRKGRLHAPGQLTLNNLELASGSAGATFLGMPRNAAIAMMKSRDGKITVKFTLDGDINDPRFSLNENLATRVGTSIASTLGVSLEGLAKGVGGVGVNALKGIGQSVDKLIGK